MPRFSGAGGLTATAGSDLGGGGGLVGPGLISAAGGDALGGGLMPVGTGLGAASLGSGVPRSSSRGGPVKAEI